MIRYNIATHKQINVLRFVLICAVLIIFSILLITGALGQLADSSLQFRKEKQDLQAFKDKIETISQTEEAQKKEIIKIKSRWKTKRQLLNGIIRGRRFPYIDKLDQMEQLLPAGVMVTNITMATKRKDSIGLTLAAVSSKKLVEAYDTFKNKNLIIHSETEDKGLFKASVSVILKTSAKPQSKTAKPGRKQDAKSAAKPAPVRSEDLRKPPPKKRPANKGLKNGRNNSPNAIIPTAPPTRSLNQGRPDGRKGRISRPAKQVLRDEEGRVIRKRPPVKPKKKSARDGRKEPDKD